MSIWIDISEKVSDEDIEKYGLTVYKNEVLWGGEKKLKAFLYSKFSRDKELILKQEGFEDERLNLNELFNEK